MSDLIGTVARCDGCEQEKVIVTVDYFQRNDGYSEVVARFCGDCLQSQQEAYTREHNQTEVTVDNEFLVCARCGENPCACPQETKDSQH